MTLSTWAREKYDKYKAEKAEERVELAKASKEAEELRETMRQEGHKRALEARLERIRNRPTEEQRRKEMLKQKLFEAAKKAAQGAKEFGRTGGGFGQGVMAQQNAYTNYNPFGTMSARPNKPKKYMIRKEPYNPFEGL